MAQRRALRLHYTDTKSGAGLQSLKSDIVPSGELWCIQRHSYEGSAATSGGNTRARVHIEGHGYKHYLSDKDGPTLALLYWDPDPVWLSEGECLVLEWDHAVDGNKLDLYIGGYREDA